LSTDLRILQGEGIVIGEAHARAGGGGEADGDALAGQLGREPDIVHGPGAGRITEVAEEGRHIQAADKVDVDGFLNYVLELFRQ